ncbi:MAG TPA: UDP-N-acetylmuramoyl-L-alanine--D-glutamate ligase [Candidatus Kapabacteria bacterium]|nr:UDP-N-acetylmuramoyl-L-alanine--D-glutamate ligase [Candidatus Kapabacteria bacterium]
MPTHTVIGSARSGLAAVRLLRAEGATVFVSDSRPAVDAAESIAALEEMGVEYEFGGHTDRVLEAATIVLSPGVPDTIPIVRKAVERGLAVVGEIEIAAARCRAPIVAITGTNGKTTTTELAGHIFRTAGRRTFVAGNVGLAFSEIAAEADETSVVVLEVSSFQLEHIVEFRPRVAIVTNVTPDHMDRYASFEAYLAAKLRIAENQTSDDTLIVGVDSAPLREAPFAGGAHMLAFSQLEEVASGAWLKDGTVMLRLHPTLEPVALIAADEIRIRGPHNLYNAMAASLAAAAMGVEPETIARSLREFPGVAHRLEPVGDVDGVAYVNDSKATNVDSVRYALASFDRPIVLIAGGVSKHAPYDAILDLVRERVKAVVLVGEAADEMQKAFEPLVPVHRAGMSLEDAVAQARRIAEPGDVVLLSPACASFDMFRNYEHRGDRFRELVQSMATAPAGASS